MPVWQICNQPLGVNDWVGLGRIRFGWDMVGSAELNRQGCSTNGALEGVLAGEDGRTLSTTCLEGSLAPLMEASLSENFRINLICTSRKLVTECIFKFLGHDSRLLLCLIPSSC